MRFPDLFSIFFAVRRYWVCSTSQYFTCSLRYHLYFPGIVIRVKMRFQNPFTEDNFVYSKLDVCAVATAAAIVVVLLVKKNIRFRALSWRQEWTIALFSFYMEQAPKKTNMATKSERSKYIPFLLPVGPRVRPCCHLRRCVGICRERLPAPFLPFLRGRSSAGGLCHHGGGPKQARLPAGGGDTQEDADHWRVIQLLKIKSTFKLFKGQSKF